MNKFLNESGDFTSTAYLFPPEQKIASIPNESRHDSHSGIGNVNPLTNYQEYLPTYSSHQKLSTIFLICAETNIKTILCQFLEQEQHDVLHGSIDDLAAPAYRDQCDLILIDLGNSNTDVESIFTALHRYVPEVPVILMDEPNRSSDHKQFCIKHAFAYLTKPCNRVDLLKNIKFASKNAKLLSENRQLRQSLSFPSQMFEFYGHSPQYELQCKKIIAYARLDGTVFITGEKGVGKGVVAQHIHLASSRARNPMIVVSCDSFSTQALDAFLFGHVQGALPEFPGERIGMIEAAEHGTLYLDRINEMPLAIQAKICYFLKDRTVQRLGSRTSRQVDTRIIAGANSDLVLDCLHGKVHKELYNRLSSMIVNIHPLRENQEDIPAYAKCLLVRYAKQHKTSLAILSQTAINKLKKYSWPGNLREFKSVIYRACAIAKDTVINEDDISFDQLYSDSRNSEGNLGLAGMTMAEIERRAIIETINACGGNRAESARQLGVSEKTIYNKFRQFKLKGVI